MIIGLIVGMIISAAFGGWAGHTFGFAGVPISFIGGILIGAVCMSVGAAMED